MEFQDSGKVSLVLREHILHREFLRRYGGETVNDFCSSGCCHGKMLIPSKDLKVIFPDYYGKKYIWYYVLSGDKKGWVAFTTRLEDWDDLSCDMWKDED